MGLPRCLKAGRVWKQTNTNKRTQQRNGGTRFRKQSLKVPVGLCVETMNTSNTIHHVCQSTVKSHRPKNTASNLDTSLCLQYVISLLNYSEKVYRTSVKTARFSSLFWAPLRRNGTFFLQAREKQRSVEPKTTTRATEYRLDQSLNNETFKTVAQNVSDSKDFKLCETKSLQRGFCVGNSYF